MAALEKGRFTIGALLSVVLNGPSMSPVRYALSRQQFKRQFLIFKTTVHDGRYGDRNRMPPSIVLQAAAITIAELQTRNLLAWQIKGD